MLLALASLPTRQPVVFALQGRTAQAMASAPGESCTPPRLLFYLARLDQRQTRHISSTLTPSSFSYVLQTLLPSTTTTTITITIITTTPIMKLYGPRQDNCRHWIKRCRRLGWTSDVSRTRPGKQSKLPGRQARKRPDKRHGKQCRQPAKRRGKQGKRRSKRCGKQGTGWGTRLK